MMTSPQYMRDAGSVPPGIPKKKSLYLHMASEERAAETVYRLMPRLTKEELCQRMSSLGDHPDGRIAQAYASWLLLRRMPPSDEKAKHWEEMTARLREALEEKENEAWRSEANGSKSRHGGNENSRCSVAVLPMSYPVLRAPIPVAILPAMSRTRANVGY